VALSLGEDIEVAGPGEAQARSRAGAPGGLTRREREIAGLLAEGLTNKEIAARLVISQRTAETHVDHILSKLGMTSRAQVASWVAELEAR
jgi:DNA-binding NarL/FixJ family response regulator